MDFIYENDIEKEKLTELVNDTFKDFQTVKSLLNNKKITKKADDIVVNDDDSIDVITSPENFFTVKDALLANDLTPDHSEITMEPANRVGLNLEDAQKFMKLIERLEDLDDTQDVYHNADISDEILSDL